MAERKRFDISDYEEFVRLSWQANSINELAELTGYPVAKVNNVRAKLSKLNVPLKTYPRGGGAKVLTDDAVERLRKLGEGLANGTSPSKSKGRGRK